MKNETKLDWNKLGARERDALVAREIFKWSYRGYGNGGGEWTLDGVKKAFGGHNGGSLPGFTTEIKDAWMVVERMREKGYGFNVGTIAGKYAAMFEVGGLSVVGVASTAPEAICLAALRAVGVEV